MFGSNVQKAWPKPLGIYKYLESFENNFNFMCLPNVSEDFRKSKIISKIFPFKTVTNFDCDLGLICK